MQEYFIDNDAGNINKTIKARRDPFIDNREAYDAKLQYENEECDKLWVNQQRKSKGNN